MTPRQGPDGTHQARLKTYKVKNTLYLHTSVTPTLVSSLTRGKSSLLSSDMGNPRRPLSKSWSAAFRKPVFCERLSLILKSQTVFKAFPYFYLLVYPDLFLPRLTLPGSTLRNDVSALVEAQ